MTNSAIQLFAQGGIHFMIPLCLLSVFALAVVMERVFFYYARSSLRSREVGEIHTLLQKANHDELRELLAGDKSLTAMILREALSKENGPAIRESECAKAAERHLPNLFNRLWALDAVGQIAPLLGLLGTVVGLAVAFHGIAQEGLSQQSVAKGIAMALITTITGLGIAIPTLLANYWLRMVAERKFRWNKAFLQELVRRNESVAE